MTAAADPTNPPRAEVWVATITPFRSDGELDTEALAPLFGRLLDAGVDGVFVNGTTGEFVALDDDERATTVAAALDVFGADRVIAHIGAADARHAVRLARRAAHLGANRLAAITPYYLPAGPHGLRGYYESICAAVPEAEVFVYLFEQRTGLAVSPEDFAALATIPGVIGAKVSGRQADRVLDYAAAAPGALIYAGNDRAFADVVAGGGTGVVSGKAGVFPQPWVAMAAALRSGDADAVSAARVAIDRASDVFVAGELDYLKAALAEFGLPTGPVRVALDGPDDVARQRIRAAVDLLN